ncbi:hypothetical protein BL250_02235 [Erwinia sp. OLTSP20]|uniref:hypothetical protein n=1 Tax=unclassified Erwinia TaxID=2622719 RepID=UPI000C181F85|nr:MULTISPECIES: hypothetical protein [unclassified Erwinia]PIJ48838.1 hypothetical protein BV501_16310 [Erwinia sp. OAMSP11]PIJ69460.1 hypothetical protein BK416_15250 [Erwinia sp. OLSSP12]PIJ79294.1 hypothetical protein BLD47_15555 [Erwinia sp. OLCASP19]PIJ80820.1 hypothetical protein BLD46_14715 [Erwinia sp. OLMTSP26]PIJ82972.1 hypothetical protein BLD49_14610 [Erwinia sp. OLMDSP33]
MATEHTIEFLPFHSRQKSIYRTPAKRKVIRAGRRFGKTTMLEQCAGNWSAHRMRVGWFAPSYKILLPSYKTIRNLLKPVTVSASKTDMIIELIGGGQVEFWTLDNPDAGRSRKYHKIIIDEASLVKKGMRDIWEQAIEPTLLDYDGDAVMAGTPKGVDDENFFYQACNDKALGWEEHHVPTTANPQIKPSAYAQIVAGKPPLVVQQEYLAEFVDWRGQNFFKLDWLLENGEPVDYPAHCDTVYGVVDCAQKGDINNDGSACIWFAIINYPTPHLIILDWDIIQIDGYFLKDVVPQWVNKTKHLAEICLARMGCTGLFIEDKATGITLLQQGANEGWNVHPIDSGLTALSKESRAINISGYVASGKVRVSKYAYEKISEYKQSKKNHLLTQVLQFIIGEANQDDDLFDCFNYGVTLGLGNGEGF